MKTCMGWERITSKRKEWLYTNLQSEVDIYNQYLTGQVYGYKLLDKEGSEIESCWGFYGDYNEIPKELSVKLKSASA